MEEIKIECPCGARYKFDFEPFNHRLPGPVSCPVCQLDGTEIGNRIMAERYPTPTAAPPPRAIPVAVPVNVPAASPEPVAPSRNFGLRVNKPIEPEPAAPAEPEPVVEAISPSSSPKKKKKSSSALPTYEPNLALAILGGVIGAVVGMLLWYWLLRFTGKSYGIVAWFIGAMIGFSTRVVGRDTSTTFGVIAAACTVFALYGGRYLATSYSLDKYIKQALAGAYHQRAVFAKEAVDADSDAALKEVIARYATQDGDPTKPEDITEEDLTTFRQTELPDLKKFQQNPPTREQFEADLVKEVRANISGMEVLKSSYSLFTVLFSIFGIASAFKIAAGFDD